MATTIKDVARLAGVGLGTASRAISGRGSVSAETLARVNAAVAALGFRPSNVARALSTKTLGMLGVYVPDFAGSFYGPVLQTVDSELRAVGRHMVAANGCSVGTDAGNTNNAGNARQQALDGIEFLIERQCDGVLVMSNALTDADFATLAQRHPRMVLVNRRTPALKERCFSTDHHLAGRLAARALIDRGHRDIACITGPHNAPDNEDRFAGFHDELARHKLRVPKKRQVDGDFSFDGGYAAARALLDRGPRAFSALFCANDVMAMAAIACLHKAGLSVPHELSVMGFDDSELARYTTPALTTVRIPIVDTAASGCRHLLNLCYGLALPFARDFPPAVVWRDSVGDGPHAASVKSAASASPAIDEERV